MDKTAGSTPGNGSRAAVAEDLGTVTKCPQQARNLASQDGTNSMPLNVTDSIKQLTLSETADMESSATPSVKKPIREGFPK
ncbi:hypothetical protein L6164_004528 [Bauhinia variegata]|uniref:Uncharacterized protein n=1 Tax=Bauhinia variegata TaxID=167791 RepID=A0ACB9Q4Y7_BAUVA|nr:hypothetical protein L6164_004528 [Bauhinia variegata]